MTSPLRRKRFVGLPDGRMLVAEVAADGTSVSYTLVRTRATGPETAPMTTIPAAVAGRLGQTLVELEGVADRIRRRRASA